MQYPDFARTIALVASGLLVSFGAQAMPVMDFTPSSANSSVELTNSTGLSLGNFTLDLSSGLGNTTHSLSEGQSTSFDFFDIGLPEAGVGSGSVEATLAFDDPQNTSGTGYGTGEWISFFVVSAGSLSWDQQPGAITTGNGSIFSLEFEELHGIDLGTEHTVEATITADSIAVPEPGSLALLGLGLAGMGARLKSRR